MTTRYNDLVKGHIANQKKLHNSKRRARKNSETPPPKKSDVEIVVKKQPKDQAPQTSVHEEPVDENPTPEWFQVPEDRPPPGSSNNVPVVSPDKEDVSPPSKLTREEGKNHQSEPSAKQPEQPPTSSVSDPQVTEQSTSDKLETRLSPSHIILEKQEAQIGVEQSTQADKETHAHVCEEKHANEEELAYMPCMFRLK